MDRDDHQQQGGGIDLIHQAMNHVEHGNYDEAWDVLNEVQHL